MGPGFSSLAAIVIVFCANLGPTKSQLLNRYFLDPRLAKQLELNLEVYKGLGVIKGGIKHQCFQFWLGAVIGSRSYKMTMNGQVFDNENIHRDLEILSTWLRTSHEIELAEFAENCTNYLNNVEYDHEEALEVTNMFIRDVTSFHDQVELINGEQACAHLWYAIARTHYPSQVIFGGGSPINIRAMRRFLDNLMELPKLSKLAMFLRQCQDLAWN